MLTNLGFKSPETTHKRYRPSVYLYHKGTHSSYRCGHYNYEEIIETEEGGRDGSEPITERVILFLRND